MERRTELECNCDETEVCKKCTTNPDKHKLSEMHKAGNITINHFFKAKDLEEPLNYICNDWDCMYCRNR